MNRKRLPAATLTCLALTLVGLLHRANADAADEMKRLASLMDWKPGTIVADIGAGDGRYAFAAAQLVGPSGKVFATEIDQEKLAALKSEVTKRHLANMVVIDSKEADTNLPAECCDAIFLRRVYHHLTKPAEFDQSLQRSLKPGGRLAIIEFPPRASLAPVEGVPANRGGHGIPPKILIEELTSAGLQLVKTVSDWPADDYLVLFVRK
ncbi:MAG TPA: methyltransferase domain-containing protein [Candidatus Saccharimonadales bacterium]|jgi:ubiquinone/menaquinone biosynthesis C-methylase UbiE|nr:methyltransferase domain-containing protein [Candidatus Saccharimonadales bacterium]